MVQGSIREATFLLALPRTSSFEAHADARAPQDEGLRTPSALHAYRPAPSPVPRRPKASLQQTSQNHIAAERIHENSESWKCDGLLRLQSGEVG